MELKKGVVIGSRFKDDVTGEESVVGNIAVAVSGKVIVTYRDQSGEHNQFAALEDFVVGKTPL